MINLPDKFKEEIRGLLGNEYEAFINSYNIPLRHGLRANKLKINADDLMDLMGRSFERIPWNENGFYVDSEKTYSRNPFYYAGLYYIQEPSAMLPAGMLPIDKGDIVLDMCAAPGGKSTALGAKLNGTGMLVSNDISASRAKALLKNIELSGITNSLITAEDPEKLISFFPEFFDKILIDAPCSGEGMFHKKPGMTEKWNEFGPEFYNEIQKRIIIFGANMLKPGGLMVYSTCTFSRLENEDTINYLLKCKPEFEVIDMRRIWPHKDNGEGHFCCLLRKNGEFHKMHEKPSNIKNKASYADLRPFYDFINEIGLKHDFDPERLMLQKDHLSYIPDAYINTDRLRVLRHGWYLGNIKNNRFEPSGSFAMGIKGDELNNKIIIEYDAPDIVKYLKCETLNIDGEYKNGWYLIMCGKYPLGWGKLNKGTLKNKYPAGWRWMS